MIDAGLTSLLAADSNIAAILQAAPVAADANWSPASGIFQIVIPEDRRKFPCLSYQFVGGSSGNTLDGRGGIQTSRVQIDCWAITAIAAKQLGDAVRQCLDNYQGTLSDGTWLQTANMLHPGIDFFSDESRFYRRMLEFYLVYNFTS